jgi:ribosomal protein L14E/L6E/L27E
MEIEQLKQIDQIKEGDLLLISDGKEITHAKAQRVKVSEHDGTEVIFNLRKNKYFNVGMYLDGKSWAKDVRIVRMSSNDQVHRSAVSGAAQS